MPILEKFPKQPGEVQDYNINFSDYILSMGEALDSAHSVDAATVSGPDSSLTITDSSINNSVALNGATSTFIKVWTAGGTTGCTYKITARILTAGGRKHEAEIEIKVKEV